MDDSEGGGQIGSCLSGLLFLVGSKVLHPPTLNLPGSWLPLPKSTQFMVYSPHRPSSSEWLRSR